MGYLWVICGLYVGYLWVIIKSACPENTGMLLPGELIPGDRIRRLVGDYAGENSRCFLNQP